MTDIEQIRGDQRHGVLQKLIDDNAIVTFKMLGQDYERLTIITALRLENKTPYFVIDPPVGFERAVAGIKQWRFYFECLGKDKIQHRFRTLGGRMDKNEIRVPLPESIERFQRRRDFRIPVPASTVVEFAWNQSRIRLGLKNISRGGMLATLKRGAVSAGSRLELRVDQKITNLKIELLLNKQPVRINVDQARVVRLDKQAANGDVHYALKITAISTDQRKHLLESIYALQREQIRKRQRIYE